MKDVLYATIGVLIVRFVFWLADKTYFVFLPALWKWVTEDETRTTD